MRQKNDRLEINFKSLLTAAVIAAALCLAFPSAFAEGSGKPDELTVKEIKIEGNKLVEKDAILEALRKVGVKEEGKLNSSIAKDGIQKLYSEWKFQDVSLYVEREDSCAKCVILTVKIKEVYVIHEVKLKKVYNRFLLNADSSSNKGVQTVLQGLELSFKSGKKTPLQIIEGAPSVEEETDDDITKLADVKSNQPIDREKLSQICEKIDNYHRQKGALRVFTTFTISPSKSSDFHADVVFVSHFPTESTKVYVKEVVIIGNEKVPDKELKKEFVLRPGDAFTWLTDMGIMRENYLEHDMYIIEKYYQDHGYLKAKVEKPQIYISGDERFMTIVFRVTEGDRYKLNNVYFAGDMLCKDDFPKELPCTTEAADENLVYTLKDMNKRLRLKKGEYFNKTKFGEDLQALTDLYMDKGYAYANLSPLPVFDEKKKTVSLVIDAQRGSLVYIERIDIGGNTKTRDKVIRREMVIAEGDLFSSTGIKYSKARIYRLGYFETVEITNEKGSGSDKIILKVEIKEKSTGQFQLGFGFSSIENFIFQAQIAQNNFLGRGQYLALSAQISSSRRQVQLRFFEPYFLDTKWTLSLDFYNQEYFYSSQGSFGSFSKLSQGGEIRLGYPIIGDLFLIGGYKLSNEQVNIGNHFHAHLFKDGLTSELIGSLQYDSRDNRLFPTSGMFHMFSTQLADGWTGSQLEYVSFTLNNQFYLPVWWKLVLKFNLDWGWVVSLEENPNVNSSDPGNVPVVPVSQRYLLGGIYSIRGYDFGTISPKLKVIQQDDPTYYVSTYRAGGVKKFLANVELELPIIEQAGLKWIFFFDAGNTWSESEQWFYVGQPGKNEYNLPLGLFYSWGFGFRWYSPLGPLRFEWGIPLTPRPEDPGIAFEFSIGNPF